MCLRRRPGVVLAVSAAYYSTINFLESGHPCRYKCKFILVEKRSKGTLGAAKWVCSFYTSWAEMRYKVATLQQRITFFVHRVRKKGATLFFCHNFAKS